MLRTNPLEGFDSLVLNKSKSIEDQLALKKASIEGYTEEVEIDTIFDAETFKTTEGRTIRVSGLDALESSDVALGQISEHKKNIQRIEYAKKFGVPVDSVTDEQIKTAGLASKDIASEMYGKKVRVLKHGVDQFGRDIATVYNEQGVDVGDKLSRTVPDARSGASWNKQRNIQRATERKQEAIRGGQPETTGYDAEGNLEVQIDPVTGLSAFGDLTGLNQKALEAMAPGEQRRISVEKGAWSKDDGFLNFVARAVSGTFNAINSAITKPLVGNVLYKSGETLQQMINTYNQSTSNINIHTGKRYKEKITPEHITKYWDAVNTPSGERTDEQKIFVGSEIASVIDSNVEELDAKNKTYENIELSEQEVGKIVNRIEDGLVDERMSKIYNEQGAVAALGYAVKNIGNLSKRSGDSLAHMVILAANPYISIPAMAGMIDTNTHNNTREFIKLHKRDPNKREALEIDGFSALESLSDKIGADFIFKGNPALFKAMLQAKNKLGATGRFLGKIADTIATEGASGAGAEFAAEMAVKQDITKIDKERIFVGAVQEIGAAGAMVAGTSAISAVSKIGSEDKAIKKAENLVKDIENLSTGKQTSVANTLIKMQLKAKTDAEKTAISEALERVPENIKKDIKAAEAVRREAAVAKTEASQENIIKGWDGTVKGSKLPGDKGYDPTKAVIEQIDSIKEMDESTPARERNEAIVSALYHYEGMKTQLDTAKNKYEKDPSPELEAGIKEYENNIPILEKYINDWTEEFRGEGTDYQEFVKKYDSKLYSVAPEDNTQETIDSISKEENVDQEALTARKEMLAATSKLKSIGKNIEDVGNDIIEGDKDAIGLNQYLSEARKGKLAEGTMNNFLKFTGHIQKKAETFLKAMELSEKDGQSYFVSKGLDGLEIQENRPEKNEINNWWEIQRTFSKKLVPEVEAEAQYAKAVSVLVQKQQEQLAKGTELKAEGKTREVIQTLLKRNVQDTGKTKDIKGEVRGEKQKEEREGTSKATEKETSQEGAKQPVADDIIQDGPPIDDYLNEKAPEDVAEAIDDSEEGGYVEEDITVPEQVIPKEASHAVHTENGFVTRTGNRFIKIVNSVKDGIDNIGGLLKDIGTKNNSILNNNQADYLTAHSIVMTGKDLLEKAKIPSRNRLEGVADMFELMRARYNDAIGPQFEGEGVWAHHAGVNQLLMENDKLPDQVIYAMANAFMVWMNANATATLSNDSKFIADYLYAARDHELSDLEFAQMEKIGLPLNAVSADAGRNIVKILGIKFDNLSKEQRETAGDISNQEDLEASIGLMMFDIASGMKWRNNKPILNIKKTRLNFGETGSPEDRTLQNGNTLRTVIVERKINGKELGSTGEGIRKAYDRSDEFFHTINGVEAEKRDIYDKPPENVQQRSRGSFSKLDAKVVKLLTKLQNVAWKPIKKNMEVFSWASDETMRSVLGYTDIKTKHKERRSAVNSKNNTIDKDIKLQRELTERGGKKFFFKYMAMNQSRFIIDSNGVDPLRSKQLHRFFIGPSKGLTSTVDVTSPRKLILFKLAIVQSLGSDFDKRKLENSIKEFSDIARNKKNISVINEIIKLQEGTKTNTDAFNKALVASGVNAHGMAGLVALAEFIKAERTGKKTFSTTLGIEVDGVTNGYAIGLMQFLGVDRLNKDKEKNSIDKIKNEMLRVGVTDGEITYEDFLDSAGLDTYQYVANIVGGVLGAIRRGSFEDRKHFFDRAEYHPTGREVNALQQVHGSVYKGKGLISKFGRDLTKSPFMIKNYGSALIKAIGGIVDGFKNELLDQLAEFQVRYNDAKTDSEKKNILNEVNKYSSNLDVLGSKRNGYHDLVTIVKRNGLLTHKINDIDLILQHVGDIYTPAFDAAFDALTRQSKEVKDTMIESMGFIAFAFKEKYERTVAEAETALQAEGKRKKLNRSEKRDIADSLVEKFFPKLRGAWSQTDIDGKEAFIDMIGSDKGISREIKNQLRKGTDRPASSTIRLSKHTYNEAGAKVLTNMVQNFDATVLGKTLLENENALGLHDAFYSGLDNVVKIANDMNKNFIETMKKRSIVQEVTDQITRVFRNVANDSKDGSSLKAAAQMYRENSFESKNLERRWLEIQASPELMAAMTENQIATAEMNYQLSQQMTMRDKVEKMIRVNENVQQDRDQLVKGLTVDDVFQYFFPVTPGQNRGHDIEFAKQTKEKGSDKLYSVDMNDSTATVEQVLERSSLKEGSQEVFNMLGNLHQDSHLDNDKTHSKHLQTVLDTFVSKVTGALDGVSLTVNKTDKFARGWFDRRNKRVNIDFNRFAPESHAEQTSQEVFMHELVHAVGAYALDMNTRYRNRVQSMYNSIRAEFDYTVFLNKDAEGKIIFLNDEKSERLAANRMYQQVFGKKRNRETYLQEFLAYGLTNKFLVQNLKERPAKQFKWFEGETWFDKVMNAVQTGVEVIKARINQKNKSANMYLQLMDLTADVNEVHFKKTNKIAQNIQKTALYLNLDKVDPWLKDFIGSKISDDARRDYVEKIGGFVARNRDKAIVGKAAVAASMVGLFIAPGSTIGSKMRSSSYLLDQLGKARKAVDNKIINNLYQIYNDITKRPPIEYGKMIDRSHMMVEHSRTEHKEFVKAVLMDAFIDNGANIDSGSRRALTSVFAKTDIASLLNDGEYTVGQVVEFIQKESKLNSEIKKLRNELGIKTGDYYHFQVNGMANRMVRGETFTTNIFENAEVVVINAPSNEEKKDVAKLDRLISLKALSLTTSSSRNNVMKVIEAEMDKNIEANGIIALLNQLNQFKARSLDQAFKGNKLLMIKGYISNITDPHKELVVEEDTPEMIAHMELKGFKYIKSLKRVGGETVQMALYHADNNAVETRTKGMLSVTSKKMKGFGIKKTVSRNEKLTSNQKAKLFQEFKTDQTDKRGKRSDDSTLRPVVNNKGQIVDYTHNMNHTDIDNFLSQNLDVFDVVSTMEGHLTDKVNSEAINKEGIDTIHKRFKDHYKGNEHEFVNIFDTKIYDEYFTRLPKEARYRINLLADGTGDQKTFMVEEAYLNALFGYMNFSAADLLGDRFVRAKRYTRLFEELVNNIVGVVNNNIVVKTIDVPIGNFTSNYLTSTMSGVPFDYVMKYQSEATKEILKYQADAQELKKLDIRIGLEPGITKKNSIVNRRAELVAKVNANPVKELVDLGLYNVITEVMNEDEYSYKNKLIQNVEEKVAFVDRKGAMTQVVKEIYMAEDTESYKSMLKVVQMSDFIARYALFKHLTEEQGKSKDFAYEYIQEMFINYNIPVNRIMQWANNMGLILFTKYWMRVQRATIGLLKHNPARVIGHLGSMAILGADPSTIFSSGIVTGGNFMPVVKGPTGHFMEVVTPSGIEIGIDVTKKIVPGI